MDYLEIYHSTSGLSSEFGHCFFAKKSKYIEANNLNKTNPQLANILRKEAGLWESGLDSVSQNIIRKKLDAELTYTLNQQFQVYKKGWQLVLQLSFEQVALHR